MLINQTHQNVIRVYKKNSFGSYEWLFLIPGKFPDLKYTSQLTPVNWISKDTSRKVILDMIIAVERELLDDPAQRYDLVEIEYQTHAKRLIVDIDEMLEIKRINALEKLTVEEIAILGLEKFSTYNKLKYHNAKD